MTSRGQCPRGGGACECLHPPPFKKSCIPAWVGGGMSCAAPGPALALDATHGDTWGYGYMWIHVDTWGCMGVHGIHVDTWGYMGIYIYIYLYIYIYVVYI